MVLELEKEGLEVVFRWQPVEKEGLEELGTTGLGVEEGGFIGSKEEMRDLQGELADPAGQYWHEGCRPWLGQ